MNKLIWKIRGVNEKFSDEQLVLMIKQGSISGEDFIATSDMKEWIKVKNSIYQYYLKENKNETI